MPIIESTLPVVWSDTILSELYTGLKEISVDPGWYSNPCNKGNLPFPVLLSRPPADRFDLFGYPGLIEFEYIGRERFSDLWKEVESMKIRQRSSRLYILGTAGYGKSHMLAALACLLSRLGRRVVYLPSCHVMLQAPQQYIQQALICAFADPSSSHKRREIRALKSMEDTLAFCRNLGDVALYFIVDRIDSLEHGELPPHKIRKRDELSNFLLEASFGHYSIFCAVADYRTALNIERKSSSQPKLSMLGGMSKVEMKEWWRHYQDKVPHFRDEADRMMVEDLTGCIPLFLRPLLKYSNQDFREIEDSFRQEKDLKEVWSDIQSFAGTRSRTNSEYEIITTLFRCLTHSSVKGIRQDFFDYCYFYPDGRKIGRYTCGLARDVAMSLVRETDLAIFLEEEWLNSMTLFREYPTLLASMVERTCLSAISAFGLNLGHLNLHCIPTETRIFHGTNNLRNVYSSHPDRDEFYIPSNPYFKNIDAFYLQFRQEQQTAFVIPIQITIGKRHRDSEGLFYADWPRWIRYFVGWTLSTIFVWIVEDDDSRRDLEARFRETESDSNASMPEYQRVIIPVRHVYKPLGDALVRRRRALDG